MMLPTLISAKEKTTSAKAFYGIDRRENATLGSFYEAVNMAGDRFPALCTGDGWVTQFTAAKPNGLLISDKMIWADGGRIYVNGALACDCTDTQKTMTPLGAQVLILPDRILLNTVDMTTKNVDHTFTATSAITYSLCLANGIQPNAFPGANLPDSEKDYWLDTSQTPAVLRLYSAVENSWNTVATTYIRISATGLGAGFSKGDGVGITGSSVIADGNYLLEDCGKDFVTVIGVTDVPAQTKTEEVTVQRTMPDMTMMCQMNNRLWGVDNANHQVHACKLGDPTNWNVYTGLSTDSYTVTIGSPGDFTGITTQMGNLLIFQENCFYKLYGSQPSQFRLSQVELPGVKKGCEKSLVSLREFVYYVSKDGVTLYDGADIQNVGERLGQQTWDGAMAMGDREQYLLYCGNRLYVYDASHGIWLEKTAQTPLCMSGGCLLLTDGRLQKPGVSEKTLWSLETSALSAGEQTVFQPARVTLIAELAEGSEAAAYLSLDGGEWRQVTVLRPGRKRACRVHLIPRRCDTYRIKIEGAGAAIISHMTVSTRRGGDR